MQNIELQAAKSLLDEGIKVPVSAPLFLRVFGKRKIYLVVRQPYLGTLYRISKIYLETGMDNADNGDKKALYINYAKPMSRVVAQAILNGYWSGKLMGKLFAWWLVDKISPLYLENIISMLQAVADKEVFQDTIRSVGGMIMTTPNQSQTEQGS